MKEFDKRLTEMEKDIEYIKKEQKDLKIIVKETNSNLDSKFDTLLDKINERFKEHEDFEDKRYNALSNKFASKYVERGFWAIVSFVFMSVGAALLTLILK